MIEVRDLTKHFGMTHAVKGISFDVARGEVLGFLGPNGAGKSTTMRMITGYIPPTAGSARIAGIDLAENSLEVRRRIGYLPESAPLYGEMEVVDFLRFVGTVRGIPPAELGPRMKRMIERCGLEKVVGRSIHHLSKGYRQRVGIAQAMIHDPDLLILDEPTSGLDPNQIVEIRELIKELGREKTVILSTHILPEVSATCGRVIIINEGKIVGSGTPQELSAGSDGKAVVHASIRAESEKVIAEKLLLEDFIDEARWEGTTQEGLHRFSITASDAGSAGEKLFTVIVKHGWTLGEMRTESVSLEDVFRKLTRGEAA
ncbi:MAG: ATP-binding cassette domain-containing protein [Gemmatimonadetes bacterium]|nr:ATP-binding cassette domain-containing protein [Gemmatimonadota bacterium]